MIKKEFTNFTQDIAQLRRHDTNYMIQTPAGVIYDFGYTDYTGGPVYNMSFAKSSDGGATWGGRTFITGLTGFTIYSFAVWYDRWSGIAADLIHIVCIDDTSDDVKYVNIDAGNNDAVSSVYTIFAGASTAVDGTLSITRTRGGNLICGGCIDAGAEPFFKKSTDVGVNWANITSAYEATTDQLILLPGWAVDNQDAMCFYWDASADEISRKLYDDSGNSWAETSISGSMTDVVASSTYLYPNFSAAVDITNSQNLLLAWSASDAANADLRCWKITEGAITEVANVVTNSTDDQGMCAIGIDTSTNYWYAFYYGASDGSETYPTAVKLYMKVSQDAGTTWGAETAISGVLKVQNLHCLMRGTKWMAIVCNNVDYFAIVDYAFFDYGIPRATFQLGM